jgi:hypothetical protein
VKSVVGSWISTSLNSAIDAENISVSISPEKNRPVQNPIPIILVTIIAGLAWIICFFAGSAAVTEQEEAGFPSRVISVKNVKIDKAMSNVKAQGSWFDKLTMISS